VAALAVIACGQAYGAGFRLPSHGPLRPLSESINQLAIFSPIGLLILLRRCTAADTYLRRDRIGPRLGMGVLLAGLAVAAYSALRSGLGTFAREAAQIATLDNVPIAVQVFCEDVCIALLITRLDLVVRKKYATPALAGLVFAAAHVPAMIARGATGAEFTRLVMDGLLAAAVIAIVRRSADIWWIWPVHTALDATQFSAR
jgi:hypothetical protein